MAFRGLDRIVSGGQTGVDRAALDIAIALGIPHGGWIPAGRRTEDGPLSNDYHLTETSTAGYPERTMRNVRDSDATLVVTRGRPTGGTALTVGLAKKLGRPFLLFDLTGDPNPSAINNWLVSRDVSILNVAGPRESTAPGIYDEVVILLRQVFAPQ
jgi:putative molybdenum carrier protein